MSGLLSLLDDVAALAKLAAVHIDDVASQASRAGVKIAGSVIDDAAKAGTKSQGVMMTEKVTVVKNVAPCWAICSTFRSVLRTRQLLGRNFKVVYANCSLW